MICCKINLLSVFFIIHFHASLGSKGFYSFSMTDIEGKKVDLSKYSGKVSLVVNVASECGYTDGHYKALTKLHDQLSLTNKFNVLAFPCNQFGAQEPKSNNDIFKFVRNTYGAKFPMFSKINVLEENIPPAWQFIIDSTGESPNWNFWKYLISHEGEVLNAWGPWTEVHAVHADVHKAIDDSVEIRLRDSDIPKEASPQDGREDL